MGNFRNNAAIGTTIAVVLLLAWGAFRSREPVYQGKGFRAWLSELCSTTGSGINSNALVAVRAAGPKGVPWLLDELAVKDSRLKLLLMNETRRRGIQWLRWTPASEHQRLALYGFAILGSSASNAVPDLMKRLAEPASARDAALALSAIAGVGPLARALGPPGERQGAASSGSVAAGQQRVRGIIMTNLCHALTNSDWTVRRAATDSLADFVPERRDLLPLVCALLRDAGTSTVNNLSQQLIEIDPNPEFVLPELAVLLKDPDPAVRLRAAIAFRVWGPQAVTALPMLREASTDPDPTVRDAVEATVRMIAPRVVTWEPGAFPPLPPLNPPPPPPSPRR